MVLEWRKLQLKMSASEKLDMKRLKKERDEMEGDLEGVDKFKHGDSLAFFCLSLRTPPS